MRVISSVVFAIEKAHWTEGEAMSEQRKTTGRSTIVLAILVFGVGCSAQMVKSAAVSASPYAPLNEQRTGIVKYLNDGAQFVVKKRREDAYKRMFESCAGPYRITAEGDVTDGRVVTSTASGTSTTDAGAAATTTGRTTTATGQSTTRTTASGTTFESDLHFWHIQYACAGTDSTATKKP